MVLTPSTMLPIGAEAPDFKLEDVVSGKIISRDDFKKDKGLLVMFICNHCPFVKHVRTELGKLSKDYATKPMGMVGINSNDISTHPDDRPEKMKSFAKENNWLFPYLFDETQAVAKRYRAACTPDFFLFSNKMKLVYRGQLDGSRPENGKPVTGEDLRSAMDAVLIDKSVNQDQKPSMGCNIKWKKGNAPDYFPG